MAEFAVFVYALFPVPAILWLLLMVPFDSFQQRIVSLTQTLMLKKIRVGPLKIPVIGSVIIAAMSTLIVQFITLRRRQAAYEQAKETRGDATSTLGLRWRAERNLWIAGFALFLWVSLYLYAAAVKRAQKQPAVLLPGESPLPAPVAPKVISSSPPAAVPAPSAPADEVGLRERRTRPKNE